MAVDFLISLSAFAFVSSFTPGPNNLMLMASGANFGMLRTVRHLLGVVLGFAVMLLLVGFGLANLFEVYPITYLALKAVSAAYLIFLAIKIANAAPIEATANGAKDSKPLTYLQAALFQWVNPKAWAMALAAIGVYARPDHLKEDMFVIAFIFSAVGLPTLTLWIMVGVSLRRFLVDPKKLRIFNITAALLLIGSVAPMIIETPQG